MKPERPEDRRSRPDGRRRRGVMTGQPPGGDAELPGVGAAVRLPVAGFPAWTATMPSRRGIKCPKEPLRFDAAVAGNLEVNRGRHRPSLDRAPRWPCDHSVSRSLPDPRLLPGRASACSAPSGTTNGTASGRLPQAACPPISSGRGWSVHHLWTGVDKSVDKSLDSPGPGVLGPAPAPRGSHVGRHPNRASPLRWTDRPSARISMAHQIRALMTTPRIPRKRVDRWGRMLDIHGRATAVVLSDGH